MKLGDKLRRERELWKYSQNHVEKVTGINRATISLYENNEREITLTNLTKLATFYGKTLNYFLQDKISEDPLVVSYRSENVDNDTLEKIEWAKSFVTNLYEMNNLLKD